MKNEQLVVDTRHGKESWNITAECRKIAGRMADRLGLPLTEFLTQLSQGAYLHGRLSSDEESPAPAEFKVTLPKDKRLRDRVTRAANIHGQTIENFVWDALVSHTECMEESMIFDKDGSVIGDALELYTFRTHLSFRDPNKGASQSDEALVNWYHSLPSDDPDRMKVGRDAPSGKIITIPK